MGLSAGVWVCEVHANHDKAKELPSKAGFCSALVLQKFAGDSICYIYIYIG